MKKIYQVLYNYTCDQNLTHFDAYFSDDENEQGKTICVYDNDSRKVIFFNNEYRNDPKIIAALEKVKGKKDSRFTNGFTSWAETYYEIVQAITGEISKDEPRGLVKERHETQGHGGLYELAEELTNDFETIYKDFEWDGQFFDEIDKFFEVKVFQPDSDYKPITDYETK